MDRLTLMAVFVKAVELGSFSAVAAERLWAWGSSWADGLPPSSGWPGRSGAMTRRSRATAGR